MKETKQDEETGNEEREYKVNFCTARSLIELPHDIITRILILSVDSIDFDKTSRVKLQNVLNFLFTCKYAYGNFRYILYTLRPINVRNHGAARKGTRAGECLKPPVLQTILMDQMICKKIKVLNYFVSNSSMIERIGHMKMTPKATHQMNCSGVDKLFLDNMYKFSSLVSLHIVSSNPKHMGFLLNAPSSLVRFKFSFDIKHRLQDFLHSRDDYVEMQKLMERFRNRECHSKLEYFKISSSRSIMHSKVHSLFLINKINLPSNSGEFLRSYFAMSSVRQFEKLKKRNKANTVLLGKLIYEILSANRVTLKLIEFEKFDLALALSGDMMVPELQFPCLRVLLFDTVSYMRMDLWLRNFQLNNLSMRNDKPLFLVMMNTISDVLMTKTATSVLNETASQTYWSTISNPGPALVDIKKELDILV